MPLTAVSPKIARSVKKARRFRGPLGDKNKKSISFGELTDREIRDYAQFFEANDLEEFELEEDGVKIRLVRKHSGVVLTPSESSVNEEKELPDSPPKGGAALTESKDKENPSQVKYKEIKSPVTGTFYAASMPGSSPFVSIGSSVKAQETVCIIEAMKVMNEIKADQAGKIIEILVQDGESVQASQVLMRLE